MEIFNYRVGNKVVRKDGLIGKIVDMVVDDKYNKIYTIEYKNGEQASFIIDYRTSNKFYEDFFSIGGDTYGNVVNIEEFENLNNSYCKQILNTQNNKVEIVRIVENNLIKEL